MDNKKRWQRAELLIFSIVTILNLLPYISTRFFPSMDGASHLANANIISQLVFHQNEFFSQFFRINPEPVPNWTAHLMIVILNLVLPVFLSEKVLIIVLMAGIPMVFRGLMNKLHPSNVLFSYLVFPFTHSMFLFFGFFNFCMGILFFFIALRYWLNISDHPWKPIRLFILAILIAATYFSHILVFGALLITIAMHIVVEQVLGFVASKRPLKVLLTSFFQSVSALTAASVIPLALFIYFFLTRPGVREIKFIPKSELLSYLYTIRPLISFNAVVEGRYTMAFFLFFAAIIIMGLIFRLSRTIRNQNSDEPEVILQKENGREFQSIWLLTTMMIFLILYFFLPDAYGTASYTNLRLGFIFFLLMILWFSTFRMPWWTGLLALTAGLTINTLLNRIYQPSIHELGNLAESCYKASQKVKEKSLVLPIYVMDNWFTGHFVDYLAVDKPVVMVYNYECESGYFPVIWNNEKRPNYYLGNPADSENYINFEITRGRPSLRLDYVFVVGHYDPQKDWFFKTMHNILSEQFKVVYESENCTLFENTGNF